MDQTKSLPEIFREICAMEIPLGERLSAFSSALRVHGLPWAEAYDDLVARLANGQAGSTAPKPGDAMPPFALADETGRLRTLNEFLSAGPVVLSFNRGHWCEYCEIELTALKQALDEFGRHGARVISIMPETTDTIARASAEKDYAFTVLADENNGYALSCDLAIWLGEPVRELYVANGLQLERYQGSGAWFVPIPATFVVGPDGRIAARYVDPDFRKRMEIDDILAALRAIRQ